MMALDDVAFWLETGLRRMHDMDLFLKQERTTNSTDYITSTSMFLS